MTSSRCDKETASCVHNQLDSAASTLATRCSTLLQMAQRCRLRRAQRQHVCCPSVQLKKPSFECYSVWHSPSCVAGCRQLCTGSRKYCPDYGRAEKECCISATPDQTGSRLLSQATRTDVRDLRCTTSVSARLARRSLLARCLQYPLQVSRLERRRTLGSDASNMVHP